MHEPAVGVHIPEAGAAYENALCLVEERPHHAVDRGGITCQETKVSMLSSHPAVKYCWWLPTAGGFLLLSGFLLLVASYRWLYW